MMKRLLLTTIFLLLLAACSPNPAPVPTPTPAPTTTPAFTFARIAMGYVEDAQFAPFFVSEKKGYFSQEGLKIIYGWGLDINAVRLLGDNKIDFAVLSGDQVIQARAQGIPLVYVANWYNAFQVEIVSLKSQNILTPKDLVGKKVGLPSASGAAYTAWRSLLYSQKIDPASITVQSIGLNEAPALMQGKVDAAVMYAYYGLAELKLAGQDFNEIKVTDYTPLVGIGIATNETIIQQRPEFVRSFVRAVTKGVADSIANPDTALEVTTATMPVLGGQYQERSKAELAAVLPMWKNSPLGMSKPEDWQAMEKTMREAGIIQQDVDATKAFTNQFIQLPN